MTLESLIEDLEAGFERICTVTAKQITATANRLTIAATDQTQFSLVAPILATDFIAGLDEQTADWLCIQKSKISEVRFNFDAANAADLPTLRARELKLEQFLSEMPMPISVAIKTSSPRLRLAAIVAVSDGLLFLRDRSQLPTAIGLDSVEFLRIIETADKNELQEWLGR
ncbi:MAG: hypothetical protein KA500_04635 [Rhodoluna sp.]|nr:hypothetical protein [Rhodoluna sp.]